MSKQAHHETDRKESATDKIVRWGLERLREADKKAQLVLTGKGKMDLSSTLNLRLPEMEVRW